MRIKLALKKLRSARQFHKYAAFGTDFKFYHCSGCFADKPGLIQIGDHCDISGVLYSMGEGRIRIGCNTVIHRDSFIGSVNSIQIGNCVIISNNVKIYDNNNHPTSPKIREEMCRNGFYGEPWRWTYAKNKPVVIEDNVWIGERSTILKGVHIGKGAVVASNTVVVKDVPPFSLVAGNPGRVVKQLEKDNDDEE